MRLALVFCVAALATRPGGDPPLAFSHVTVVDVEAGRLRPEQTVIVSDGRIGAIIPSAAAKIPPAPPLSMHATSI